MVFFPVDALVDGPRHASPPDRAVKVSEAVGLPPHAHDAWTDCLDVHFGGVPIIGKAT